MEFDPAVAAYYARGEEKARLSGPFPSGPLEFERTKELMGRYLPHRPSRIADVGGGPGVYAAWLAGLGHSVTVLDPVPLHIEQARASHPEVDATLGDARALPWADETFDVVLLLGPLYHLPDRDDRLLALTEAHRVLVPGGVVVVAAISRFAALLDMLVRLDRLHERGVMEVVAPAVSTGEFRGAEGDLFTNAYFHLPDDLQAEVRDACFDHGELFNIEGPGFMISDFEDRWDDPERRNAMLETARLVESEPSMLGASSHLLAVARRSPPDNEEQ